MMALCVYSRYQTLKKIQANRTIRIKHKFERRHVGEELKERGMLRQVVCGRMRADDSLKWLYSFVEDWLSVF